MSLDYPLKTNCLTKSNEIFNGGRGWGAEGGVGYSVFGLPPEDRNCLAKSNVIFNGGRRWRGRGGGRRRGVIFSRDNPLKAKIVQQSQM